MAFKRITGHRLGGGDFSDITVDGSADLDCAVTVNESGEDVDFRGESDDNENMLFVDGGNDRVGIGLGDPEKDLHIKRASGETTLRLESGTFYSDIIQNGRNLFIQCAPTDGNIIFYDDAAERMRIASDGAVGIGTNNPSSLLHLSSTTDALITIDADTSNDTEDLNPGILFTQDGVNNKAVVGMCQVGKDPLGGTLTDGLDNAFSIVSLINAIPIQLGVRKTGDSNATAVVTVSGTTGDVEFAGDVICQGFATAVAAKTASYECAAADYLIIASRTITVTLPENADAGRVFVVKRVDDGTSDGTITVSRKTSDTIDGATSYALDANYKSATFMSDGANWHIVSEYTP